MADIDPALQDVSLPRLDSVELQRATFEHYDLSHKGGSAKARDVVMILEGDAQKDWIARRELDFLRTGITAENPKLLQLMKETTSPRVKAAILETIYGAIAQSYPALAPLASQVCMQKKQELSISEPPPSTPRKGVAISLEIAEPPEAAVAREGATADNHMARSRSNALQSQLWRGNDQRRGPPSLARNLPPAPRMNCANSSTRNFWPSASCTNP